MPSPLQMTKNFGKAVAKRMSVPKEQRTVPKEERERRTKICQSCDYFKIKLGRPHCSHMKCGCTVARKSTFWTKTGWATERCPLDPPKWDVYTFEDVKVS